jgi:hypothetical protein
MNSKTLTGIGIIITVLLVWYSIASIGAYWEDAQFQKTAMTAQGTVLNVIEEPRGGPYKARLNQDLLNWLTGGNIGRCYYPVLSFQVGKTQRVIQSNFYSIFRSKYRSGQVLKVYYLPQNPNIARQESAATENQFSRFCLELLSILFVLLVFSILSVFQAARQGN